MKVLMVNKFLYPNGGSETYMLNLGKYLESLGHSVQYFGMQDSRNIVENHVAAYVPFMDFKDSKNILKKIKMSFSTIYSRRACMEIKKVLQEFKPDVVHMNNINFQLTPAIIYEIKRFRIPIIQTVHDVQMACPCHRFYIEHKQTICEECQDGAYWKCTKHRCVHGSLVKSVLASLESYYYHFRNTYNLVDMYICPSKFIADRIERVGICKNRITVMYNFSDTIENQLSDETVSKYVLYFGRFSKEKGIDTFLGVCKNLPHIKFVLAGSGPLIDHVRSASENLDNVDYVGFKTGEKLNKLIAEAAFSVYPSEWYENCPLSVIESKSLGTPVIGSDLGGTKELIIDGKDGMIFEGCNQQALLQAIQSLWDDDELIAQMSRQCLKMQNNTITVYTQNLLLLYDKFIREGEKLLC